MARYYFHYLASGNRVADPEGSELENLEAARMEVLEALRELWAAAILLGNDLGEGRVEVTDGSSAVLLTIQFEEALPVRFQTQM